MELIQKMIQVNEIETVISHQFHLHEDVNVPDAKEDVVRVLQSHGRVCIRETVKMEQYLKVRGCVKYQVLYATNDEEKRIACIESELAFEEMIYVEGEEETSYYVKCNQLDFEATLIHSRKLSLKGMLELTVEKSKCRQQQITVDAEPDSGISLLKKRKKRSVLEFITSKTDTYRIKEELKIPGTKENIGSLLTARIGNVKLDTRASHDEILLRGELQFFCMYISEEWKEDFVAQTVPFEGKLECFGIEEAQLHYVRYDVEEVSVEPQMDEDGELRILNIEATLKLQLQVYSEQELEVLDDAYTLEKKCELHREELCLESLVLQNQSKCKIIENLTLPELRDDLLQICTADGMVEIERVTVGDFGIEVEGILHAEFLYLKSDDSCPYDSWKGMIPFQAQIECKKIEEMIYNLECHLEQISVTMAGNGEVEIKAIIHLQSFVRKSERLKGIERIQVNPYTKEELEKQAGIIGYIYKENDEMWDLAKRFHTTIEGILKNNKISEKDIKVGQKLLIFEEKMSIL